MTKSRYPILFAALGLGAALSALGPGAAHAEGAKALGLDRAAHPALTCQVEIGGMEVFDKEPAKAGVCVWSCQYNAEFDSWKYWFAPSLSSCPVTKCQPRNGSSPSGTRCSQGDPDIPGDCDP